MARIFRIFQGSATRQIQQSAGDIAARCVDAVTRQMRADPTIMGVAELHGYVRACARPIVRVEVQRSLMEGRKSTANATQLMASVLERTVAIVVRDLQSPPVIAIAAPHVSLRAAA